MGAGGRVAYPAQGSGIASLPTSFNPLECQRRAWLLVWTLRPGLGRQPRFALRQVRCHRVAVALALPRRVHTRRFCQSLALGTQFK